MVLRTPGIWEEIPTGATVHATRFGTVLVGEVAGLMKSGADQHKSLALDVSGLGRVIIHAPDHWEVQYEVPTVADLLRESAVGCRFIGGFKNRSEIVKVSDDHVTLRTQNEGGYWGTPEVKKIDRFTGTVSESNFRLVQ